MLKSILRLLLLIPLMIPTPAESSRPLVPHRIRKNRHNLSLDLARWNIARAEAMPPTKNSPAQIEIASTNTIPVSETPIYLHPEASKSK